MSGPLTSPWPQGISSRKNRSHGWFTADPVTTPPTTVMSLRLESEMALGGLAAPWALEGSMSDPLKAGAKPA